MTREKFIKKWLSNIDKLYNEENKEEMREDLDAVIAYGIEVNKSALADVSESDLKPYGVRLEPSYCKHIYKLWVREHCIMEGERRACLQRAADFVGYHSR